VAPGAYVDPSGPNQHSMTMAIAHRHCGEGAEQRKSDIYGELLPLVNDGLVEWLDQPRLVSRRCALADPVLVSLNDRRSQRRGPSRHAAPDAGDP